MNKLIERMRKTIIVLVLTLTTINLSAQSGWQQVYTGSDNVRDMSFVAGDDNSWGTGWILTTSSNLLKTTNGGDTWTLITQSEATAVNGICFVDENIGFMSSANGVIIKSIDGGVTWTTVYENSNDWFGQLAFKDTLNGVVSGDPDKYTSDGGVTWNDGTYTTNYDRVDYASGDTYFSCGLLAGKIGKSDDNGASWTDVKSTSQLLVTVESFNETYCISGGSNFTAYYTTNGGTSWTERILSGGSGDLLCSGYFDKDTIYVAGSNEIYKSTDGGINFLLDTTITTTPHRAMFVTPTNVVYIASDPMQVWRKIGPSPLLPDFEASDTFICAGTIVDFTDMSFGQNISSWSWTFEGGTPSSSTDQNPSISYSTPGIYDVELTVTDDNGTETKIEYDYITVIDTPEKPEDIDGDEDVCTGFFYNYTIPALDFADNYEWELLPADAGTLEESDNEANLEVAEDWTGDFTLRVRADNSCGVGEWSDLLEGTVNTSPEEFSLEGGGSFCEGDEGVELTLDGSQSGIEYELYLDGDATGITVDGTGSEITFGLVTEEGYYSAYGTNGICTTPMMNQVEVEVIDLPAAPATPTGPDVVCNTDTSYYETEGAEEADSYIWSITPSEAGTINGDSLIITVDWAGDFSGEASIIVSGINDCGEGESSEEIIINVEGAAPEISGESMVCDYSIEMYEVAEHEGSTYNWTVTGGDITDGAGTYVVTVTWAGPGDGMVSVEEETANGCVGNSEEFTVIIDDCTEIGEINEYDFSIYPNPANNEITISHKAGLEIGSEILIYNSMGQIILEKTITNQNRQKIDIASLKNGMYFLEIVSKEVSIARKTFIKVR